jgi:DNA repair photolyase
MTEIHLVTRGPKTCWPGDYHYLEPWIGCDNGCLFCFARHRVAVRKRLAEIGSTYSEPKPFHEPERLLNEIRREMQNGEIKMIRPSRFTDLFSPSFVASGMAFEVLKALCDSPVPAIAICTKGIPDSKSIDLIIRQKGRVRYYANIRPETGKQFEPGTPGIEERIKTVSYITEKMGSKWTAVHIDPLILGIDTLEALDEHLDKLKENNLSRVMFSFLMLNEELVAYLNTVLPGDVLKNILSYYEYNANQREVIKGEKDTTYFFPKADAEKEMVKDIVAILKNKQIEFIICYLKNFEVYKDLDLLRTNMCFKGFYA